MIDLAFVMASDGLITGGMENQVAIQANHIAKNSDYRVHVVAHPSYEKSYYDSYANSFGKQVTFHPIPCHLSRHNPRLLIKLSAILRKIKPTIIHCHGTKSCQLIHYVRPFIRTDKAVTPKVVTTVHGTKKASRAIAMCDRVFAVSNGVSNALAPLKSYVIGNAVSHYSGPQISKEALCTEYQLNSQRPLLIAAGRLSQVKAYDALMSACEPLNCNLLIFGDGPEKQTLSRLERAHIRLAGHKDDVRPYFGAADALIISSHREGLSMVLLEALQQELPVWSTPVSGSRDLLPESWLLRSNEVQVLRDSLEEKLVSNKQTHADVLRLRKLVNSEYSPEVVASKLCAHYSEMIS